MRTKVILWVLVVLVVLGGGILRFALAVTISFPYDLDEYQRFGQKAMDYGLFGVYAKDGMPRVSYPPLMAWLARAALWIGGGSKGAPPTDFKTPFAGMMCLCDMGLMVVLLLLGLERGIKSGLAAATIWAFNPASLFDSGYWIQSNPPLLFTIGLAAALGVWKRWFWAGLALGLACLLKPQAWILIPALWLWAWHDGGRKAFWRTLIGLMAPIVLVLAGFTSKGTIGDIRSLFTGISIYMTAISVNAHNFWWLVQLINGQPIDSQVIVLGVINIRYIALILLGVAMVTVATLWWRKQRQAKGASGAEMLAIMAMLFFLLGLHQHENHGMPVLALVAVAWAAGRKLGWQLGIISAAVLLNCIVFDPTMSLFVKDGLPQPWTGMHSEEQAVYLMGSITGILSLMNVVLGFWWIKRFLRKDKTTASA